MLQQVQDGLLEDSRLGTQEVHLAIVERVIQTMHGRLREVLTLEDMADIACLSPYYFSRVFRRIIGLPPGEFLSTLRLDMAKRLLLTTSLSVTDICFEVGYVGLGSFTTRFTQLVGLSPRHLRHIAKNAILPPFAELCDTRTIAPARFPCADGVSGRILTTSPFSGFIFAGLFPKAIPQGQPVRCTLLSAPGSYRIDSVPDGCYFLLVAALPISENPHTYLMPQNDMLVGMRGPIVVHRGKVGARLISPQHAVDITLRPPCLTDPPIISALPFI